MFWPSPEEQLQSVEEVAVPAPVRSTSRKIPTYYLAHLEEQDFDSFQEEPLALTIETDTWSYLFSTIYDCVQTLSSTAPMTSEGRHRRSSMCHHETLR